MELKQKIIDLYYIAHDKNDIGFIIWSITHYARSGPIEETERRDEIGYQMWRLGPIGMSRFLITDI